MFQIYFFTISLILLILKYTQISFYIGIRFRESRIKKMVTKFDVVFIHLVGSSIHLDGSSIQMDGTPNPMDPMDTTNPLFMHFLYFFFDLTRYKNKKNIHQTLFLHGEYFSETIV